MNSIHSLTRSLAVLAVTGLVSVFAIPAAHAVDCANPPGFAARKACEKAAQGIDALRRYVERTRAVHALYVPDFKDALPAADLALWIESEKRGETSEAAKVDILDRR